MNETPIYDQLRGERINADVPATRVDQQRAGHPVRAHLDAAAGAARAVPAFGRPPGPGAGLTTNQRHPVAMELVEQGQMGTARRAEPASKTHRDGTA